MESREEAGWSPCHRWSTIYSQEFYISASGVCSASVGAEQSWAEPAVDVGGELDTTVQLLDIPTHNLAHVLFMISFDYPDRI